MVRAALKQTALTIQQQTLHGHCSICSARAEPRKPLCVDHDHITGMIRGVLCINCNSALGFLGDRVEGLQRAIAYLDNPPMYAILDYATYHREKRREAKNASDRAGYWRRSPEQRKARNERSKRYERERMADPEYRKRRNENRCIARARKKAERLAAIVTSAEQAQALHERPSDLAS